MKQSNLKIFSPTHLKPPGEKHFTILLLIFFLVVFPVLIIPVVITGINYVTSRGEARDTISDINRSWGLLEEKAYSLNQILLSWSAWDELHTFMEEPNSQFIEQNFDNSGLISLDINSQIILDNNQNLIYYKNIDLKSGQDTSLPFEIQELWLKYPILLEHDNPTSSHVGLLTMGENIILAASRPIITGSYEGPIQGTLIFLVFFTPDQLAGISSLVQRQIRVEVVDDEIWSKLSTSATFSSDELKDDLTSKITGQDISETHDTIHTNWLVREENSYVKPIDQDTITGFQRMQDLNHENRIFLQVISPRDLHHLGILTKVTFCFLIELLGLLLFTIIQPFARASLKSFKLSRDYLERFQAVVRQMDEAILIIDPSLNVLDASPVACQTFGFLDKLCEKNHEVKLDRLFKLAILFDEAVLNDISQRKKIVESQCVLENGQVLDVEINASKIHYQDTTAYILVVRDISERIKSEQALRASEERYQLATLGANDGIWDWNLITNEFYYSPRWKSMLGYRNDEIGSSPDEWMRRVHPEDRMNLQTQLSEHLRKRTKSFQCEHRLRQESGDYHWFMARGVAVWNQDGYAYRMAGSFTDIHGQKKTEEQLRHDALHDSLTGLGNRVLLIDRLKHINERKKRRPETLFAVFFLDLDRFKQVNDTLGHKAGDYALITCSSRLQHNLRMGDSITRFNGPETLTRIAGDEFVLLIEDLNTPQDALNIAERIMQIIEEPINIEGKEITLSTSLGIVVPQQHYKNPEEIIRDADIAMYQAKQKGSGNIVLFNNQMYEETLSRMEIENSLRRAIDRKEFEVYYQPFYMLNGDQLAGFEALIRWNHPQRGLLLPMDFLSIAEETGLIVPIGNFVLQQACAQMQAWEIEFPPAKNWIISVNLSPRQLITNKLADHIRVVLKETELEPHKLWLEITENAIIQNIDDVRTQLEQIRDLGVRIKIDDFGTGYSSLSYIRDLPIDGLKIDRSFIGDLSNGNQQIVRSMLNLGHDLGLVQVAEGVETETQREYLRSLNCDYIQGFLMSKPIPASKTTALIRSTVTRDPHPV